jgi:hypothetical protein
MHIHARMSMSTDGYVTTPGVGGRRWSPIRRSSPARATASGGFSRACEAALMRPGNVRADTHQRPLAVAAPERFGALLATPARHTRPRGHGQRSGLAGQALGGSQQGGDVHLAGSPRTIEIFRALAALDKLEATVLPLLFEAGMRLTRHSVQAPG